MCQLQSLRDWDYKNLPLKRLYDSRIRILWSGNCANYLHPYGVRSEEQTMEGRDPTSGRPGCGRRRGECRSRKEIDETGSWGAVNGCVFLREMDRYCGGTYKVLKTVEYFDRRGLPVQGSGHPDGLVCGGGGCSGAIGTAFFSGTRAGSGRSEAQRTNKRLPDRISIEILKKLVS
jgi:hypothetical protein